MIAPAISSLYFLNSAVTRFAYCDAKMVQRENLVRNKCYIPLARVL